MKNHGMKKEEYCQRWKCAGKRLMKGVDTVDGVETNLIKGESLCANS
jgi:hypothetical protein